MSETPQESDESKFEKLLKPIRLVNLFYLRYILEIPIRHRQTKSLC